MIIGTNKKVLLINNWLAFTESTMISKQAHLCLKELSPIQKKHCRLTSFSIMIKIKEILDEMLEQHDSDIVMTF